MSRRMSLKRFLHRGPDAALCRECNQAPAEANGLCARCANPALEAAVEGLISASFSNDLAQLNPALAQAHAASSRATPEERNRALGLLAQTFEKGLSSPLVFFAGALLEQGADVGKVEEPLLRGMQFILDRAVALIAECPVDEASGKVSAEALAQSEQQKPDLAGALATLEAFWQPLISVLGASPRARAQMRPLAIAAQKLAVWSNAGGWIAKMLAVLDDEPLLVLVPEAERGFRVRFSGLPTNHELHTALLCSLSGLIPGEAPSAEVRAVFEAPPPAPSAAVSSSWALYDWRALLDFNRSGGLQDVSPDYRVWGEGVPAEIPVLEDTRVLVLGAAPARTWQASRTFATLRGSATLDEKLGHAEVKQWVDRAQRAHLLKR